MTDQNQTPEQQPLTIDNEKLNTARSMAEEFFARRKAAFEAGQNYEEKPSNRTLWHYQEAVKKKNAALDAFLKLYDWQDNLRIIQALRRDDYPLTFEILQEWGADTQEGLKRCMDNSEFYLKLCSMSLKEISARYIDIHSELDRGNTRIAYEKCKSILSMTRSLGLIPMDTPITALRDLKVESCGKYYYPSFPLFFEKEDLPYLAKAEYEFIRCLQSLESETTTPTVN